MKNQNSQSMEKLETFFQRALGMNPERMVKSISAFSKIFAVFALLFLGAFIYKIASNAGDGNGLKLTDGFQLQWLYTADKLQFGIVAAIEMLRLLIIASVFYYLNKFSNTIEIENPYANPQSKLFLSRVALLSVIFFIVDALGAIHLNYTAESYNIAEKVRIFHYEYLFLMYFINIFSALFSKGVDLKNEINMVV